MNAAVLLVTSAWLAGAAPAQAVAPVQPVTPVQPLAPGKAMPSAMPYAPSAAAPLASGCSDCGGCGGSCDCDCGGHSWRDKMRGWFHKSEGCGECGSCGNECGSCSNECGGHKWRDKMRGWFHRDDCCQPCGGCDSCGGHDAYSAPAGTTAPPPVEKLDTKPKELRKMPNVESKSVWMLTPVPAVTPASRVIIQE